MNDDHDAESPGAESPGQLDLVVCPGCAAPAEVVDRYVLPSTDGPVQHVKVQCLGRHWFVLPAAALPAMRTVTAEAGTGPVR